MSTILVNVCPPSRPKSGSNVGGSNNSPRTVSLLKRAARIDRFAAGPMLAYGNSQRTLRFSYQGDFNLDTVSLDHQVGHSESNQCSGIDFDYSGPNSPLLRPAQEARETTPGEKHNSRGLFRPGVTPSEAEEEVIVMSRRKLARQDTGPAYLSGGGHGGSTGPADPKIFDTAPAGRPTFRLNLDLGSDSDTSGEEGEDRSVYRGVPNVRQDEKSQTMAMEGGPGNQSSHSNSQCDVRQIDEEAGIEPQCHNRRQGVVRALEAGGAENSGPSNRDLLQPSVTPNSAIDSTRLKARGSHWQDCGEGAKDEAGYARGRHIGGTEVGALDGIDKWSQAPFVTPDHPGTYGERNPCSRWMSRTGDTALNLHTILMAKILRYHQRWVTIINTAKGMKPGKRWRS